MSKLSRRDILFIIIVLAVCVFVDLFVADRKDSQLVVLDDQDFQLDWRSHSVQIGSTPGETVMEYYPYGNMLDTSPIFNLAEDNVLFTFSEEENILQKAQIENPDLPTFRGIRVGDSFDSVIDQYGQQYAKVDSDSADDFDAVFGSDNSRCIVFQVRQGQVKHIVLQSIPNIVK